MRSIGYKLFLLAIGFVIGFVFCASFLLTSFLVKVFAAVVFMIIGIFVIKRLVK